MLDIMGALMFDLHYVLYNLICCLTIDIHIRSFLRQICIVSILSSCSLLVLTRSIQPQYSRLIPLIPLAVSYTETKSYELVVAERNLILSRHGVFQSM